MQETIILTLEKSHNFITFDVVPRVDITDKYGNQL